LLEVLGFLLVAFPALELGVLALQRVTHGGMVELLDLPLRLRVALLAVAAPVPGSELLLVRVGVATQAAFLFE
jgi:hypothetical protein